MRKNAKLIQGMMLLAAPVLLVVIIVLMLNSRQTLFIVLDGFEKGVLQVDSIDCTATDTQTSRCFARGVIFKSEQIVDSSAYLYLGYDFQVDFKRKRYPVFYRGNDRFPILNKDQSDNFNKQPYIIRLTLLLVGCILIIVGYFYLYKKLNKS